MSKRALSILIVVILVIGFGWWAYYRDHVNKGVINEPISPQVTINQPTNNQELTSPVVVTGTAEVEEDLLGYRLSDANQAILAEGLTVARSSSTSETAQFNLTLSFLTPETKTGTLEIYSKSNEDVKDTVTVSFAEFEPQTISIYFSNALDEGKTQDCTNTFPVDRTVTAADLLSEKQRAELAINLLLTGPTLSDIANGYFSNINPGTKLNSLDIIDKTALVDFDDNLIFQVGGSCKVQAITSQIENTLKQFDFIDEVVIMVNGRSEDILQP